MTDRMTFRTFPTAFKLAAIKRLEAGESVLPLARKLGVSRKLLHDWRKAWKLHGPAGLNRKRGPKPGPRKLRPLAEPAAKGCLRNSQRCSPGWRRRSSRYHRWQAKL
jgi:transposase-like protein